MTDIGPGAVHEHRPETGPQDVRCNFAIWGETAQPDIITHTIGVQPDRSWSSGDSLPRGRIATFGLWEIRSGMSRDDDIDAHVAAIMSRVAHAAPAIRRLTLESGIDATLQIVRRTEVPPSMGLSLSAESIAAIAALGADVNFEEYNFWAEPVR